MTIETRKKLHRVGNTYLDRHKSGRVSRRIHIDGTYRPNSHYVWFLNTGYWPDFKSKQEVIHHLDGDSLNDTFSNLQIMTLGEHFSLHRSGKRGKDCPNWRGDSAIIESKYRRHLSDPSLYPPLTEEERKEYRAYHRERGRERRRS